MAIQTIKFSEFASGGDLSNDKTTVGLDATNTINTRFNNPWTFLAPGTTGERPVPAASMYYRLRLNTTLQVYEYYDPNSAMWTQLSGTGVGTVNPGTANDIGFYAANGTAISPIASAAFAVLVSNGSQVPSMSTTLPVGLSIPSATITASTAALLSGSVVAAPVAGTDLTNKTYVDSLVAGGVTSIIGTTNQVIASSPTGNVTLSLPQDIALGSTPTFAGLTLTSIPLGATSGGTGQSTYALGDTLYSSAANTLSKLSGNITTTKQFLSQTGTGAVSAAPAWATITGGDITGAALTKTDDTNVTLTLGGTPATALLRAASLTLGWTGLLAIARGGTAVSSVTTAPTATAFAGWDANSNLSANNHISAFATTVTAAGTTVLTVASKQTQEFTGATTQIVTMPVTSTLVAGQSYNIINNSSGNVTVNSSGGNAILVMAANTEAMFVCVLNSGTTAASWNASYVFDAGAGVLSITGTANQVISSASTGNITLSLPQSIATTSAVQFNSVRFNTANAILDANGAVLAAINSAASAVNYFTISNSPTGAGPSFQATGSDANIGLTFQSKAAAVIAFSSSTLANYMVISPSATTAAPTFSSQGSDTNIGMALQTKGTGQFALMSTNASPIIIQSGTTLQHNTTIAIANTAQSRTMTIPDANFTVSTAVISTQIFTSGSGTYTPTAGAQYVWVRAVGGGGQGGGATAGSTQVGVGGGGGAGGYGEFWEAATSRAYSVGVGGTTGTTSTGQSGTATTFGTAGAQLNLAGGTGGSSQNSQAAAALGAGGAGGAATTATLGIAGSKGRGGVAGTTFGTIAGDGGVTPFGGNGTGAAQISAGGVAGNAATGYGSGGGGSGAQGANSANGAAGANGIIIITEYA